METSNRDGVDRGREAARPAHEVADQTGALPLIVRRRRFDGVVIATVAGCALILVAAAISRVSHASSAEQSPARAPSSAAADEPSAASQPAPPSHEPQATAAPEPAEQPTKGTVRLDRPSLAGRVWIDGKKVTSTTAAVTCGAHQVKVGASARARSLQVPCGGELVISR